VCPTSFWKGPWLLLWAGSQAARVTTKSPCTPNLLNYCVIFTIHMHVKKRYSYPITGLDRPWGFQEFEAPRFQDNRHKKVPAAFTSRNYSWYSFLLEASQPKGHSAAGRIISIKNSNDTIGNRTRDLPACSAVPQPTEPPRAPQINNPLLISCSMRQNHASKTIQPATSRNTWSTKFYGHHVFVRKGRYATFF
jgi:hypothetical protein